MIEFRSLEAHELEQWFDHCVYVFNNGQPSPSFKEYFRNHWYNDPWRELDNTLVAVDDDKIVSTIRIFNREIYLNGQKISMGGIGEVSTRPEYSGKGLSTRLLTNAIEIMEKKGMKVSMLATGIHDFYARLGWERLRMDFKVSTAVYDEPFPYKLRLFDHEKDIPVISRIYREYSGRLNGPAVRENELYWKYWFNANCINCWTCLDENDEVVAYICFDEKDDHVLVREFGCQTSCENIFDGMAACICTMLGKPGCKVKYPSVIKSSLKVDKLEEDPHIMLRLINPVEIDNVDVNSTDDLIECFRKGVVQNSGFVFWGTDGF